MGGVPLEGATCGLLSSVWGHYQLWLLAPRDTKPSKEEHFYRGNTPRGLRCFDMLGATLLATERGRDQVSRSGAGLPRCNCNRHRAELTDISASQLRDPRQ